MARYARKKALIFGLLIFVNRDDQTETDLIPVKFPSECVSAQVYLLLLCLFDDVIGDWKIDYKSRRHYGHLLPVSRSE